MKTSTRIGLATVLSVAAALRGAEPAHRMRVLIKPGAMNQAVGKGDVAIDISISEIDVPAGAPWLSLSTMFPGASKPQTVEGLTVKDGLGPVPPGIAKSGRQSAMEFNSCGERRLGDPVPGADRERTQYTGRAADTAQNRQRWFLQCREDVLDVASNPSAIPNCNRLGFVCHGCRGRCGLQLWGWECGTSGWSGRTLEQLPIHGRPPKTRARSRGHKRLLLRLGGRTALRPSPGNAVDGQTACLDEQVLQ